MALLAFDLGGTAVKHGVWQDDKLHRQASFKTPKTYEDLKGNLLEVLTANQDRFDFTGVAFSMPGAVNVEKSEIEGLSALPYIHGFNIFADLAETFDLPVTIENDANCAGICEVEVGVAKDANNVVFLVIGTGIGGSVFINRQLYKGSHLFAGEFGFMRYVGSKTWSMQGSAVVLGKTHPDQLTAKAVFEAYDQEDELATKLVDDWLDIIVKGLYNIQMTIDPELIVIGGGVSKREDLPELIRQKLLVMLEHEKVSHIMPQIASCQYFNDANLIGAALNFEKTIKKS